MPSCFVEQQLTQRRERRVGHVPQGEYGGLPRALWRRATAHECGCDRGGQPEECEGAADHLERLPRLRRAARRHSPKPHLRCAPSR